MGTDIMNPVFYNLGFTQKQTNDVRFGVHLKEKFVIGAMMDKLHTQEAEGTSDSNSNSRDPSLESVTTQLKGFYGSYYFEGYTEDSGYVSIRYGNAARKFTVRRGASSDVVESDGDFWSVSYGHQWGLGANINLWFDISYQKLDVDQTVKADKDNYEYDYYESRAYFDLKILLGVHF